MHGMLLTPILNKHNLFTQYKKIACQNMSGADTAPSMIYTCLHLYVLTSVRFGQKSRNHSRTVLEHTVYLRYDIKGYFQ